MRRIILLLVSCIVIVPPAFGASTSTLKDQRDPFSNEHVLLVAMQADNKGAGAFGAAFYCFNGKPAMGLVSGMIFNMDRTVLVRYRFGKKPATTEAFLWNAKTVMAFKFDGASLLHDALSSATLAVSVDNRDPMNFDLVEARKNLTEFRKRCADWQATE